LYTIDKKGDVLNIISRKYENDAHRKADIHNNPHISMSHTKYQQAAVGLNQNALIEE
jgi:hypothetical protein